MGVLGCDNLRLPERVWACLELKCISSSINSKDHSVYALIFFFFFFLSIKIV